MTYWRFIRQDWPLLGLGFLLTALSGPGQTFFVGLFRDDISGHYGITIGTFGLIFSMATLVSAVAFLWTGKLIDRWPVKYAVTVFSLLFAGAAVLIGLSFHIVLLVIAVFGVRHLGQALMGHTAQTTMARYFHNNRAKAASLASMGFASAEAIMPICVVALLGLIGWRYTWIAVAAFIALVFLPIAHFLLRRNRRDLTIHFEAQVEPSTKIDDKEPIEQRQWTRMEVIRDQRFWLLLPAMLASPYLLTGLFFHQASLASETGLRLEVIAGCFTAFAVAKMIGSLGLGPLVDRFGYLRLYPVAALTLAVAILVLSQSSDLLGVWFYYVISGASVGFSIPVSGALWPGLYGVQHLGAIRSMISSIMVLATGLAPASFGYLLDAGFLLTDIALGGAIYAFLTVPPLFLLMFLDSRSTSA